MSRPVIALLTDFGSRDHYAGTMKGVMLGICPDATLVDLTHEIAPGDVMAGALELDAAVRYFPPATIFLAVVDPGVGSARRAIAVESGGYRFVGPDNGLLSLVWRTSPVTASVELSEPRYARATVSRTFEGRDRFAPAAAWLATGVALSALGHAAQDLVTLSLPAPTVDAAGVTGEVVRVDRFGNLVTNIARPLVAGLMTQGRLWVTMEGQPIGRVVNTYADVRPGSVCALFSSTDHLEVSLSGGSAASSLGFSRGATARVTVC